jgi:uncharacterized membrane protein
MANERPKMNMPFTPTQKMLFAGAIMFMLLHIILVTFYFPSLPERMPSHFGVSGKPDAWAGKAIILLILILSIVISSVMLVVSFFPRTYNYVVRITPGNAERQYSLGRTLLLFLAFEISLFLSYATWKTIQVAIGQAAGLGVWALPVFLAAIFVPLITYFRLSYKAR